MGVVVVVVLVLILLSVVVAVCVVKKKRKNRFGNTHVQDPSTFGEYKCVQYVSVVKDQQRVILLPALFLLLSCLLHRDPMEWLFSHLLYTYLLSKQCYAISCTCAMQQNYTSVHSYSNLWGRV